MVSRIYSSVSSRSHAASTPARCMMPMLRRMVLRNSRTSFTMNVDLRRGGVTAARCKTDSM